VLELLRERGSLVVAQLQGFGGGKRRSGEVRVARPHRQLGRYRLALARSGAWPSGPRTSGVGVRRLASVTRQAAGRISAKAELFTESVIREMNRLAIVHGAVSLAQGFPDFPAPDEIKQAAADAIFADVNQYAITWGSKALRDAIAAKTARTYPGWTPDPETEITVTCGATEGMVAAMLGILDPGDEVVVFEPFYENYGPDAILTGATPRYVALEPPDWSFDPGALQAAVTAHTRAIVLNSPHNPTGKVFTRAELETIAAVAQERDLLVFTDEIYEHLVYEGEHIPMATLPGMRERTVAINSVSKTYSVTGWRVGWVIAPPALRRRSRPRQPWRWRCPRAITTPSWRRTGSVARPSCRRWRRPGSASGSRAAPTT
jgi:aspartate/methionine/tyrosine aminotransferase